MKPRMDRMELLMAIMCGGGVRKVDGSREISSVHSDVCRMQNPKISCRWRQNVAGAVYFGGKRSMNHARPRSAYNTT